MMPLWKRWLIALLVAPVIFLAVAAAGGWLIENGPWMRQECPPHWKCNGPPGPNDPRCCAGDTQ